MSDFLTSVPLIYLPRNKFSLSTSAKKLPLRQVLHDHFVSSWRLIAIHRLFNIMTNICRSLFSLEYSMKRNPILLKHFPEYKLEIFNIWFKLLFPASGKVSPACSQVCLHPERKVSSWRVSWRDPPTTLTTHHSTTVNGQHTRHLTHDIWQNFYLFKSKFPSNKIRNSIVANRSVFKLFLTEKSNHFPLLCTGLSNHIILCTMKIMSQSCYSQLKIISDVPFSD